MIRKTFIGLVLLVGLLVVWTLARRSEPVGLKFFRVTRETLVSSVSTNGKVEPLEWASARASLPGTVAKVFVQRGQSVHGGDPLVELDTTAAEAALAEATAKVAQARAELQLTSSGGRPAQLSDIQGQLDRARLDLQTAQHDYEALNRLLSKNAATAKDVSDAAARVNQLHIEIESLEQRRKNLVAPEDRTLAQAKLREAQAAESAATHVLDLSTIRAPIDGVVYEFDIHTGTYLAAGALVANVGRLNPVRVTVYVDEPDLGRVKRGNPVLISWDGLPGRQWQGRVDKPATQVVTLGSRQVGEVGAIIDNPDHDLLPGTNIDAEIQAGTAVNALSIPKEAVRRRNEQTGVMLLDNGKIVWRPIELGITTLLRAQVVSGLKEGDGVAGTVNPTLTDGERVKPAFLN